MTKWNNGDPAKQDELEFVLKNLETKMKTGQKQMTKMKGSQIHMDEKLILAKNQISLITWRNSILKWGEKNTSSFFFFFFFFFFFMFRVIYNFSIIF